MIEMSPETVIKETTRVIERRRVLRGVTAVAFAGLASLATRRGIRVAQAGLCCTGPYGTGYCGDGFCSGHTCIGYPPLVYCWGVNGFCDSPYSPCWSSRYCSGSCCDCQCSDDWGSWYCYCSDYEDA